MGQALSLAIDRVAIVNFILQKTGEPAGGLLPQWSSGTAFLFPAAAPSDADLAHAKELWKQIAPSPQLVLGYDSADPLEQSVAERIVVNAKEAGIAVKAQALPGSRTEKSRGAGQSAAVDLQLVRWRMSSPLPGEALKDFLAPIYAGPLAGVESAEFPEHASPEDIYKQQRAVLSTYRVVPLVWLPQVYGLSARVRNWKAPGPGESWPLADVWLDTGNANRSPVSLCDKRGSKAAPVTMQRRHVHTQPFAFRAPQEDDESVKLSNIARERSRALLPALKAARSAAAGISPCFSVPSAFLRVLCVKSFDLLCPLHLQKPQFLIDTNEPLFRIPEFALATKQITSKFLFDTNEIHPVTHYRLEITIKNGQNSRPRQAFSPRICVVEGAS